VAPKASLRALGNDGNGKGALTRVTGLNQGPAGLGEAEPLAIQLQDICAPVTISAPYLYCPDCPEDPKV
jgi:hypothetical protein